MLGEVREQSLTSPTPAYFGYQLRAGRSYAALCWEPFLESGGALTGFCQIEIHDFSDANVGTSLGISDLFPKGGAAATFTATSATSFGLGFVRVGVNAGTGTVRVVMIETSISSSWYFVNPGAQYEGYATIRNTTGASVSVTLTAYDPTGTVVGTPLVTTIPANGNTFVGIGAQFGATGSGSAQISHTGYPGAIVANITTISPMTGLSFDAPFTPRMAWGMLSPP